MNRRIFLKSSAAALVLARLGRSKETPPPDFDAASAVNRFGLDLFARLRAKDGNHFVSPFSLSTALAMASLGARGRTAEQMNTVLHLPADGVKSHGAFAAMMKRLNADSKDRGYLLAVANALWRASDFPIRPEFLKQVGEYYGAGSNELDFAGKPEESRRTINSWVEKQTKDRIKDLLPSGSVRDDTRLVLTNAIYFKGDWASPFDKKATHDEAFYLDATGSRKLPMMHRTGNYAYFDNDRLQILALPYKGRELSMVVILPRKRDGLAEVEKTVTAETVEHWMGALRGSEVIVALPKIKMTSTYQLVPTLSDLGMADAFSDQADFSGISTREGLKISNVIHKAFVEVNEEGAEAAAATGITFKQTSAPIGRPNPIFRADHPFLFLIRDNRSGAILFLGRVADPG